MTVYDSGKVHKTPMTHRFTKVTLWASFTVKLLVNGKHLYLYGTQRFTKWAYTTKINSTFSNKSNFHGSKTWQTWEQHQWHTITISVHVNKINVHHCNIHRTPTQLSLLWHLITLHQHLRWYTCTNQVQNGPFPGHWPTLIKRLHTEKKFWASNTVRTAKFFKTVPFDSVNLCNWLIQQLNT
jgi:hypothetical protein